MAVTIERTGSLVYIKMIIANNCSVLIVCWAYFLCFCSPLIAQQNDEQKHSPDFESAIESVNLDRFFIGMEGTFVLLDMQTKVTQVHNLPRASRRFLPASTFKIPNSLIAMETNVVDGPKFMLPLDTAIVTPAEWWPASWQTDQTLESAFQNSVYWFYQEIARRIGEESMNTYVRNFDYGNQDIGGGLDQFWLRGDIRISPFEQVNFLRRLYHNELGVSKRSSRFIKEIMILEEHPSYSLSGKTGTAELTASKELGWLVGYLERENEVYIYALNMEGERVWEDWPPQKRKELVRDILKELEVID